ncbi:MAG TPA: OmpA family protein [Polyangiaceae bacterium]|nr:OmpA family protein [Polyangiaceae bacterium]
MLLIVAACGSPARGTSPASAASTPTASTSTTSTINEPCAVVIIDAKRVRFPWVNELVKDTDEPMPGSEGALDEIAHLMESYPTMAIGVVGHASTDEKHPEALAEARGRRVRYELVKRGVDAARVEAHGAGATRPLDDLHQRKNRYVSTEIIAYGRQLQSWNGRDYQEVPFSSTDPKRDPCPRPR